jgi:hypothetical protein
LSSEDAWLQLSLPLSYLLWRGVAENGDNPFLDDSRLIPTPWRKVIFVIGVSPAEPWSDDYIAFNTHESLFRVSQCCRLCKMVVVPVAHSLVYY